MLPYIVLYFVLLLNLFFLYKIKIFQILILFVICVFIGFRGVDVGTDTVNYIDMYENISVEGYHDYPEPLYGLSCSLASNLKISYNWHQVLLCFFSMLLSYVAMRRSPNIGMSIFLLLTLSYFSYTMNIFGQMVACYICLFAFSRLYGLEKKNKIQYLLCILFIMGFHTSVVFLIPLVFIDKFKFNGHVVFFGLTFSLLLGIIDVTSIFSSYLLNYTKYLERSMDAARLFKGILLSIYWTIFFFVMYRTSSADLRNRMEFRIFFVGLIFYNVFLSKDLALRFLLYFLIPMIIWIPIYLSHSGKKMQFRRLFVILYSTLYYLVILFLDPSDIVPYIMYK